MKRIGLHNADGWKYYPNLALLKLAAFHKSQGNSVEKFNALLPYDTIYSSKVFTFSPNDGYLPASAQKGGTGYQMLHALPDDIEHTCPDYEMGGIDYSLGFLTRGCIRSCPWCVVPAKEGEIRAHADIEEFCRHKSVVLMDNNVLAHDHGIRQIEKMARLGLKVDFNQGLDARLIDSAIAERLGNLRWIRHLRLACDRKSQMTDVAKAVRLIKGVMRNYCEFWCYVLVEDVDDALERVEFLESIGITPFAQPYRDQANTPPTQRQKDFAHWCNRPWIRKATPWSMFKPRRV